MALYGASELLVRRFGGGLVRDQDATEIGDDQASDAANVDFEDETLTKRLGRVAVNGTAPVASRVWGVHRYYPRDGGAGTFLMQAGSAIYEDDGAGEFSSAHSGLTGGAPVDFLGWKERVYAGNGVEAVRRRKPSPTPAWEAVSLLSAPTAPVLAPSQTAVEAFDSGTWALSGNALSTNGYHTTLQREGSACLKLTASGAGAVGSFVHKGWSTGLVVDTTLTSAITAAGTTSAVVASVAGIAVNDYLQINGEFVKVTAINTGTKTLTITRAQLGTTAPTSSPSHANGSAVRLSRVDLSKAQFLSLWVYSEKVGMVYQVGVRTNDGTLDFSQFPTFTAREKETWVRIRVPLDRIPPADRTASLGLGIKFVEKGSGNSYNLALYFDEARLEGPLVPDHYRYFATYAETQTQDGVEVIIRESNPSPVAEIDIPSDDAVLGVAVSVAGSADTANVSRVLVYRVREHGPFPLPRLVQTLTNTGAGTLSVVDLVGEDEVALSNAPELVRGKIPPPIAKSYAVANNRLVAGHAYVDTDGDEVADTWFPWRLYLSRLGYPEEFGGDREPTDPNAPGWLDIAARDHIRRLVEFDGQLLVFCDRAIYTLEGSGWDDFTFRKRADVGLDAREAVVVTDRLVLFLASDGVRALAPNRSFDGLFETWVLSEPVDSVLRKIPAAYRGEVAFGLDERGRLQVSYPGPGEAVNGAALVFDLTERGALQPGYDPLRRGWTQYSNWGFSCFCTLKRGGGDAGQLVGGDPETGKLHYLHRDAGDEALTTDDGAAISWHWQGKAVDAGPGATFEWVYVGAEFDAASGQSVTATPVLEGREAETTYSLSLGSAESGFVSALRRCGAAVRGRFSALRLSGSHAVELKCRSARVGAYVR